MAINGTADARGFRQWQAVDRRVSKGAKAFYILGPRMVTKREQDENGDETKRQVCAGFVGIAVFAAENTTGAPLEYPELELPPLPLMSKAKEWGIDVAPIGGGGNYYGFYVASQKEIRLATPAEKTFFHELSHAAHEKVLGKQLSGGQDPLQEITAELSAQALSRIVGVSTEDTSGNSYRYIARYAAKAKMDVSRACNHVLGHVQKILALVLA